MNISKKRKLKHYEEDTYITYTQAAASNTIKDTTRTTLESDGDTNITQRNYKQNNGEIDRTEENYKQNERWRDRTGEKLINDSTNMTERKTKKNY